MEDLQLEIRLLGPVEISYDGVTVKIPRRAERAILYFLAIENRPVSRETLIDLLWPQAEQADPRGTLRTALSRLRNSLPDKTLLVTELDQVSLDFSRCSVDLVKFTKSYQSLQGLLTGFSHEQPLPVQIVNQITKSLDLWRGDRIIGGDEFYDYPELDARFQALDKDLEKQRIYFLKHQAAHYQATGQLQTALDVFIHLGCLNNQDNSNHLAVMDLLAKLGRCEEVQEFCDSLEVLFEQDYNAPLPDEIIQQCRELQKQIEGRPGRVDQKWPIPTSFNVPLVGRTAELKQLRSAFFRGGLVKIEGDMGVGKTRLVQTLFETLTPKPFLILAPGRETETPLPLAPIIHGLRRHIPDEIWKEIDRVWANQLSLMLPELEKIRNDINPSPRGKLISASQHLFDSLHHLLVLVAKKYGRILFFLDDAQWVDVQTTAAIFYLVNQGFFDTYGILIVASRIVDTNLDIDVFFEQQRRNRQVEVIRLVGLNPEDLKNLVEHILNRPISASFFEGFYRETMGIPLWVIEIMRHLLETYGDTEDLLEVTQFPLIKSAHAFIRSRFYRFTKEESYLFSCAAVIGDEVPLPLLQSVADMPAPNFLMALETIIQSRFLVTNSLSDLNNEKTFSFSHEKIREVVLIETSLTHQQILHQRVAYELSKTEDALERAAIIAEHFTTGGDLKMGFKWHLKAAGHAWNLGAAEDVGRSYIQAEKIFLQSPKGVFTAKDLFTLYYQWSDFAYQSDQVNVLEEIGIKIEQRACRKPGCPMVGLSHLILAKAYFLREDFESGLHLSQKAVETLMDSQQQLEPVVQAYFFQALLEWWTLEPEKVHVSGDRIMELINRNKFDLSYKTSAEFLARRMKCDSIIVQGEAKRALEMAQEIDQQFFDQLNTFDQLRAYNMLSNAYYIAGFYNSSLEYAEEGLNIAQVLDNAIVEILALLILCKSEIMLGYLDEAYQHAARALHLAEKYHKTQFIVSANTMLGEISVLLSDNNQAMHHFRIAQIRQGYSFQSYYGLENNIHLARLLVSKGECDEARALIAKTLVVVEEKGLKSYHVEALITESLIYVEEGDFKAAEINLLKALNIAEENGLVQEVAWAKFRLAWVAHFQGNYEQVEEPLVSVLSISRSREMVILNKLALELAFNLSGRQSFGIQLEQLAADHQALVAKLNSHTRSEAIRERYSKR